MYALVRQQKLVVSLYILPLVRQVILPVFYFICIIMYVMIVQMYDCNTIINFF